MEKPTAGRVGKASCRHYEEQYLNNVEAFHNLEIKAISEDTGREKVLSKWLCV